MLKLIKEVPKIGGVIIKIKTKVSYLSFGTYKPTYWCYDVISII